MLQIEARDEPATETYACTSQGAVRKCNEELEHLLKVPAKFRSSVQGRTGDA